VGGWGPMLVNNRLICPSVSEVKYQESVCVMVHKLMHKLL